MNNIIINNEKINNNKRELSNYLTYIVRYSIDSIYRSVQYSKVVFILQNTGFIYPYLLHKITGYAYPQVYEILRRMESKGIIQKAELTDEEKMILIFTSDNTSEAHVNKINAYRLCLPDAMLGAIDFSIHMSEEEKERLNKYITRMKEAEHKFIEMRIKQQIEQEQAEKEKERIRKMNIIMEKVIDIMQEYNDMMRGLNRQERNKWLLIRQKIKKAYIRHFSNTGKSLKEILQILGFTEPEAEAIINKDAEAMRRMIK